MILFNELQILKVLDNPNIIKMWEIFQDPKRFYIITDFLKGVDLLEHIQKRGKFDEKEVAIIIR
jgi:calcium-dependent protein kinase